MRLSYRHDKQYNENTVNPTTPGKSVIAYSLHNSFVLTVRYALINIKQKKKKKREPLVIVKNELFVQTRKIPICQDGLGCDECNFQSTRA